LDITVLGRIGYDLYALEHNRPLAAVEHFSRHLGGSSANIAVGMARLGLRVAIIACVGRDLLAEYLLGFLREEGVDTQFVRQVEGYSTSLYLTEVSPPDRFPQVSYRSRPADLRLKIGDAERESIRQARMFVTNGTSLAESPSRESTLDALRTARAAGARTVLDVDYRANSWASAEEAGSMAREALPWVDVLLGNEEEITILSGTRDPAAQVRQVLSEGVEVLVRKLGGRGVEAHTREQSCVAAPYPMPVLCAIGGGDGFAAGFLYALYREYPLEECLSFGNAAAAIVVSRVSCSDAMPRLSEVEVILAQVRRQESGARSQNN